MNEIITACAAHNWTLAGLYVAAGCIALLIRLGVPTKIEQWAEKQPRMHGLMLLLGALGLNFPALAAGFYQLILGKLPRKPVSDIPNPPAVPVVIADVDVEDAIPTRPPPPKS